MTKLGTAISQLVDCIMGDKEALVTAVCEGQLIVSGESLKDWGD
jgi:hypothetical protein